MEWADAAHPEHTRRRRPGECIPAGSNNCTMVFWQQTRRGLRAGHSRGP